VSAATDKPSPEDDRRFMRRALALAARARTHPNPRVGAVVVKDGVIVGEGWHKGFPTPAGSPHAETMAFADAGPRSVGATVYVTLEPCAHWHKSDGTPRTPCAHRCIEAGARRVVCAAEDPDARVAGRGFQMLRDAGIAVEVGVGADAAREQNRAYIRERTTGLPYITHKAAMTLDGKIATPNGDSRWVTGEAARAFVHRLRHRADAVLVGIGTVLSDDPRLTTRLPGRNGHDRNGHDPIRVILDSKLRTPPGANVARPGTVVLTTENAAETPAGTETVRILRECGVEVVPVAADAAGRVDVEAAARYAAGRGLFEILLESGGALAASFWVNRAIFFVAPKVIGGEKSPSPVGGSGLAGTMGDAVQLEKIRLRRMGADVALEAEVRANHVHGNH
jgi:diaminohydroxyphosphoribosylaminopyrimidine deaminase / 5-amino-6-(5-phosphoribosylamino)uracil reductase